MIHLTAYRKIFFVVFAFFILTVPCTSCSAQDETSRILSEIGEDWSTNMIMLYVETPNKFDVTYGTNITGKDVLDEISEIEESLNPEKDDFGEIDEICFILSISTLIKELNESPSNIAIAVSEELGVPIEGEVPGEYEIPDDQDEIDNIITDIPSEMQDLLVRDTNNDGIWDSAVVWLGVVDYNSNILRDIDELIEPYALSSGASTSRQEWWDRIETGEIHCGITNLGYVRSYEYYEQPEFLDIGLPILVILILALLLIIFLLTAPPKMKEGNNQDATLFNTSPQLKGINNKDKLKKKILSMAVVFLILIIICIPFTFVKTSASPSDEVTELSEEFNSGQIGLILVRGNPAPDLEDVNQHTRGGGSMKDIEVLDDINDLEARLGNIENPQLSPPLSIIDIMKMIELPEILIPEDMLPTEIQEGMNNMVNLSFWDAIHVANDDETSTWNLYFGKTQQESMINIFYNSLTPEMRGTFVNLVYSKSLIYNQIPIMDEEQSERILTSMNKVTRDYSAGRSTTDVVLVESEEMNFLDIISVFKTIGLFVILAMGIIFFVLFSFKIGKIKKGKKQKSQKFPPREYYPYQRYPPYG